MRKIIVITTDGFDREDGNVYYSRYIIVESDTLLFDEPIFTDPDFGPRGDDQNSDDDRMDEVVSIIIGFGYQVTIPETMYIEVKK